MITRRNRSKWIVGGVIFCTLVIVGWHFYLSADDSNISSKGRFIFIDGGSHLGETLEHFEKSKIYSRYRWELFAFEANPNLIPDIPKKPNRVIYNKAIWTEDGTVEFFLGESSLSSSVLGHKKTGRLSKTPIRVESIDFGSWLQQNFSKDDFVYLKLDIEGAEYDVLEKMLKDGSMHYVDRLSVEFHNKKVGISEEKDRELLAAIKMIGITVKTNASTHPQGDYF